MCGISGILSVDGAADVNTARRMVDAQAHRGPDATGAVASDRWCAVGHVRLSIVDATEAGNQPFASPTHVLVYNGEIYNHRALRPELERHGAAFRGTSDTATLFEALRIWGPDETLRRIQGMFAFAWYDVAARTLYLCRDRLGIKPLHVLMHGGDLLFSSEVKGLAAAVPIKVDPIRALFSVAGVADDSLDRTCFRGVRQVAPGTMVVCRPGQPHQERRYYAPIEDLDEAYYRELDGMSEAAVVSRFSGLLATSVERMLMSDAPLGVFASGGIDSSLLAALARRLTTTLPLFSSNVVGPDSEIDAARLLARSIDATLHESTFESQHFLDQWARTTWHYEYPLVRHVNAVPFSLVSRLAQRTGVKCVLTGEGSDELFLGYPKLLTRRFDQFARLPVDAIQSLYGLASGLRQHLWPNPSDQADGFLNLLVQDYQRQRLREEAMPRLDFLKPADARETYLTLQMLQEGLHSLLHRNDRIGMSASIEARFPFLDEEVVRFGINLPARFKIHRTTRFHNYKHPFLEDKWVVRAVGRSLLPPSLASRRKNGFPLPGYRVLRIAPSFFAGGFVEDAVSLSASTFDYMTREARPLFVARLAGVELLGRMFDDRWSPEQATEHVHKHVSLSGQK